LMINIVLSAAVIIIGTMWVHKVILPARYLGTFLE
jgi:hypothetical protein